MNSDNLISILRFIFLLLLQSFLLSNINFFGFINPNLYLLFIIVYRLDCNPSVLIILGFLLGLLLDLLTQGSGGHTVATLTISFLRPYIAKFSFGINYKMPTAMLHRSFLSQRLLYLSLIIFFHHLILYSLIYFSFDNILTILKNTFFTSFFTFILVFFSMKLFKEKND
jgi:rod shape-determining protein MreD